MEESLQIQLQLFHNGSSINLFEAVALMVDKLPDEKLKAKLFRNGRDCALAKVGTTLNSCEEWEEILEQKHKNFRQSHKKFKQHLQRRKAMLKPIDELIQAYLITIETRENS